MTQEQFNHNVNYLILIVVFFFVLNIVIASKDYRKETEIKNKDIYTNEKCVEQCFYKLGKVNNKQKLCYQMCIVADNLEKLSKDK